MCAALNIIVGNPNGTFKPNDPVTREQMAKMICVLDNGGKEPQGSTGNTFTDVPADRWSNPFVEACAARGVVVGIGGGKFSPAGKVTATQAAKMLLVELGYDDQTQQYTGSNWATKVNVDATKKGYYEDLEDIDVSAPLTREHAAQMVWNALKANEVEYTNQFSTDENGNLVATPKVQDKTTGTKDGIPQYITLLADKYGVIDTKSAIMTGFSYDSDKDQWTYSFNDIVSGTTDRLPTTFNKVSGDYSDLFAQNVKVIYTEKKGGGVDKVFGMYAFESSVVAEGVMGDVKCADLTADKSIEISGTDYKTSENTIKAYAVNQYKDTFNTVISSTDNKAADNAKGFTMKAIDRTDDGKVDAIVYLPFTVAQVDFLGTKSITTKIGNATTPVNLEDISLEDGIAEDDYVMIIDAKNTADDTPVYTKVDVVSGEVSKVSGKDVTVDGNTCTLANGIDASTVAVGDDFDFAVVNGYAYIADKNNSDIDISDYALITAIQGTADWDAKKPKVTLLFGDKSSKTVEYKDSNAKKNPSSEGLKAGDVVYISKIDDGVYTLKKPVSQNPLTDSEYNAAGSYDKDKAKIKVASKDYAISNDAVIFVWDESEKDGSVYTGSELKTYGNTDIQDVMVKEDSNTGLKSVVFGYVAGELKTTGDLSYGYVVADAASVKNDKGDAVTELTLADGTKIQTDTGMKDTAASIVEGTVIGYKLTDGVISKEADLKILGVVGDKITNYQEFAVTGYDGTILQVEGTANTYEITSDTVKIYVDSSKTDVGAEGANLAKAQKMSDGETLVPNTIIYVDDFANADTNKAGNYELDLIVIDVNNNINNVALKVASAVANDVQG